MDQHIMLRNTEGVWCDVECELKDNNHFETIDDLRMVRLDETKYHIWTTPDPLKGMIFAVSHRKEVIKNDLYLQDHSNYLPF